MATTHPSRAADTEHNRHAPIDIAPAEFRALGHALVDRVADFLEGIADRPAAPDTTPAQLRALLGADSLPERGSDPAALLERATDLLFDHSTLNGHPRFWGYITAPAAPIGMLGDLLAAAVNPNVGGWQIAPIATEMERQTVQWIAELLGYPTDGDGVLVSGGNMANIVGLTAARVVAARSAPAPWDVRAAGLHGDPGPLLVYASPETHTWLQSAVDLLGLGTDAIRWIPTDNDLRMDANALRRQLEVDREAGAVPMAVIGTAGTTATGAIDPLLEIAAICREHEVWFHVDGAYGGFAIAAPGMPVDLAGLREADSVAVDPHKWLYSALEVGCVLVRDPHALLNAFSYHPPYYHFDSTDADPEINYYERGPQNSRGFRALKVWLALQQVGRSGYAAMIGEDIALARALHRRVSGHPALEACTHGLSISTFRYVPEGLEPGTEATEAYLNRLNEALLTRLQRGGEVFVSNAVVDGTFLLRACIVNFRTSEADIAALPGIVVRHGAALDRELRAAHDGTG